MMPVSSGRPPSTPCPRGLIRAGCSSAPLGWRPPSASAASHTPEMSRLGAGPAFLPAYHGLIGGTVFQMSCLYSSWLTSAFAWLAGVFAGAFWARSAGERTSAAAAAITGNIKRLPISDSPPLLFARLNRNVVAARCFQTVYPNCPRHRGMSASHCAAGPDVKAGATFKSKSKPRPLLLRLKLLAVDDDAAARRRRAGAAEERDRIAVLRRHGINFHLVARLEKVLAPSDLHHGYRILRLDDPVRHAALVILYVNLYEHMWIGPHKFGYGALHNVRFVRIISRIAVMGERRRGSSDKNQY